eukprot:COSAG06_NODE_7542_length_2464_cov_2.090063_1_plen_99_part_00
MPPPRSRSPSPARELWDSASEAVRGVAQHVAQQVSAQVVATASPVAAARVASLEEDLREVLVQIEVLEWQLEEQQRQLDQLRAVVVGLALLLVILLVC